MLTIARRPPGAICGSDMLRTCLKSSFDGYCPAPASNGTKEQQSSAARRGRRQSDFNIDPTPCPRDNLQCSLAVESRTAGGGLIIALWGGKFGSTTKPDVRCG